MMSVLRNNHFIRMITLVSALAFLVSAPGHGLSQDQPLTLPRTVANGIWSGQSITLIGQKVRLIRQTGPRHSIGRREGRSYLIPAAEILAYLFLLNQFDRHFTEPMSDYRTTGSTIRQHLTDSKWVLDNDQFSVNQFLHPTAAASTLG